LCPERRPATLSMPVSGHSAESGQIHAVIRSVFAGAPFGGQRRQSDVSTIVGNPYNGAALVAPEQMAQSATRAHQRNHQKMGFTRRRVGMHFHRLRIQKENFG
jgi:hypothetical protein